MANAKVLGLFPDPQQAADAISSLREDGFPHEDLDIYSGSPFPEGTFGEYEAPHRLYVFPLVGAMVGFTVGLLITAATQISYPIVTGGKPLLSIPPMTGNHVRNDDAPRHHLHGAGHPVRVAAAPAQARAIRRADHGGLHRRHRLLPTRADGRSRRPTESGGRGGT